MKLAFENVIADLKTRQETKPKVKNLLMKLNSYRFMSFVIWYLGILEIVTLISKLFEAERLLPLGLQTLVFETIANTDNCINASIDDDLLPIFVCCLSFLKADDRTRSNSDREHVSIAFENMADIDETVEETKCFEKHFQELYPGVIQAYSRIFRTLCNPWHI